MAGELEGNVFFYKYRIPRTFIVRFGCLYGVIHFISQLILAFCFFMLDKHPWLFCFKGLQFSSSESNGLEIEIIQVKLDPKHRIVTVRFFATHCYLLIMLRIRTRECAEFFFI